MPNGAILVIDDEESVLETLQGVLELDGYAVTAVRTGAEALAHLKSQAYDVVVSDLRLDGDDPLDGLAILAEARRTSPDTAAIVLTGYATLDAAVEALRHGGNDFLHKPCNVDELREAVARGLSRRRLAQQVQNELRQAHASQEAINSVDAMLDAQLNEATLTVAHRLAQNERLYREAQRQSAENERLYRAERLARATAETAVQRTSQLQLLAAALSAAVTPDEVAQIVVGQAMGSLGVTSGWIALCTEDGQFVEMGPSVGVPPEARQQWQRIPVSTDVPLTEAIRTGEAIWYESWAEMYARFPAVGPRSAVGTETVACLPLRGSRGVLGALVVDFPASASVGGEERRFLETMAQLAAQALDRARLYQQAQDALLTRDIFFSVAAHELKTPITALQGFTQMALLRAQRHGRLDFQQTVRSFEVIESQARRLGRLVAELLDIARIERGQFSLERQETDLAALVRDLVRTQESAAGGHQLVVRVPESLVTRIDALRVEQVLANLLDNAIKYSPQGGDVEVELTTLGTDTVRLSVRDHGVGVPEEHRKRIFERFYQAHAGRPGEPGTFPAGMGIGLFVARQIVEAHGGSIDAEFPPDGGSRFVVTLPRSLSS